MWKAMTRCVSALALAALLAPAAGAQEALPRSANIGTNPQGSLFYAVGSVFAKVLSEALPTNVNVRPFTGTTLFVPLLDNGELEFGINNLIDGHQAYNGIEPWRHFPGIRLISPVFRLYGGMVVPGDSDIKTIADAKGKRISADYRAHLISRFSTQAMLANAGLTVNDFRQVPVSDHSAGIRALMEGRVDIAYGAVGPPVVREAAASLRGGLRFLPLDPDPTATGRMQEFLPGSVVEEVPAGFFVGIDEPIHIKAFDVYFTAGQKTGDALVYAATKAFYEKETELQAGHPSLKARFARDNMVHANVTVPYHRAAIRFYKEQGMWTDAAEARYRELLARQNQED